MQLGCDGCGGGCIRERAEGILGAGAQGGVQRVAGPVAQRLVGAELVAEQVDLRRIEGERRVMGEVEPCGVAAGEGADARAVGRRVELRRRGRRQQESPGGQAQVVVGNTERVAGEPAARGRVP